MRQASLGERRHLAVRSTVDSRRNAEKTLVLAGSHDRRNTLDERLRRSCHLSRTAFVSVMSRPGRDFSPEFYLGSGDG